MQTIIGSVAKQRSISLKMRRIKQSSVWVVIHCEYMQCGRTYKQVCVDELVFHVASSLDLAEKFIKGGRVDAHSWWRIQQFGIDVANDDTPVFYYTYRGRRVKRPPYEKAKAAWIKRNQQSEKAT